MYEAFIDLDELIVLCRDRLSRKFIQEAVACYRAGAFRSCVVATWNAVVFDFLHKLRELEFLGDKKASKLLREFEKFSSEKKVRELWQFESDISKLALTEFELISTVEKSDIDRLFEDRSRCAHPSMTSLEEPFEATAELARCHLRSAVTHLLQRPPVQGRAARERVFQDIKSEYFPIDPELAKEYFQKGPLARARFILIKDIVIGLTISLLTEDHSEDEKSRQFSALNAIASMYTRETREILNDQLSDIILNRVVDDNWGKAIVFLGNISACDNLSEPCRLKATVFIDKIDLFNAPEKVNKRFSKQAISILEKASYIDFLRDRVINKIQIPLEELLLLKEACKDDFFRERIVVPVLRELSPQATLDELLSMRNETSLKFDEVIESHVREKIQVSPLWDLTSTVSKYQDEWLINLIESDLKEKIPSANLETLLEDKLAYKLVEQPKAEILELLDNSITQQVKGTPFNNLITKIRNWGYWNEIPNEIFEPILKNNVSVVIDVFANSKSYDSAANNTRLLIKAAEYLSSSQWEKILEAFFQNDQLYGSYMCHEEFKSLFKKSFELNQSVQSYWLIFREKLNVKSINSNSSLKLLIDSHI
jgi:hypothetical protein